MGKQILVKKAINNLHKTNKHFFNMVNKQEKDNQKNIEFYWCPIRPERHYAIIDSHTTLVEDDHEVGRPRDLFCFKENPSIAKEWDKSFNEMIQYCFPVKEHDTVQVA